MNVADSEVVASIMDMAGYEVCEDLETADAVFLNTCSVRDNAEQKILSRLEFLHSQQKKRGADETAYVSGVQTLRYDVAIGFCQG